MTSVGVDVEKLQHTAGGNRKWGSQTVHLGSRQCLTKLNTRLPRDLAILLLGFYSRGKKRRSTPRCVLGFRAALCMIVPNCKEFRCPSDGERIKCGTSTRWNIICYQKARSADTQESREGRGFCLPCLQVTSAWHIVGAR